VPGAVIAGAYHRRPTGRSPATRPPRPERNRFLDVRRSCEARPVGLGFSGEVVDYYQRYRRGYPDQVVDALVAALRLRPDDVVLDLGCGTGQLTLPLAGRARSV